jgi:CRISPR-associated protein Csb3
MTRIPSTARPALELLAFIGLQRFRPLQFRRENRFVYTAWSDPLPIAIAAPAACGELPTGKSTSFEFRLLYRTKYLKSFLPAVPFNGAYDE